MRFSKAAALITTAGVAISILLGGGSAAFADTTPAPVFDHSVTAKPGYPVITVRSAPSGQALNDLGYLDQNKAYPSAAEVTGPPSFDGPLWIPIEYTASGPIGYVNAIDVVVGAALPQTKATPTPTATKTASTPAATSTAPSNTPPAPFLWPAFVFGVLSAAAAVFSFLTKPPRLLLAAPLAAAAAAIATSFFIPSTAGSTPLLLSALAAALACTALLRTAIRRLPEPLSAGMVQRAAAGRMTQYLLVGAVGLPIVAMLSVGAPTAAVIAVTAVCASVATSWALLSAAPAAEPEFVEEPEEYTPRAWSAGTNGENSNG